MASQLMFDIDTSPKLARAGLSRSSSGIVIPDYPVPHSAFETRACWSVPTSPVASIKRQNMETEDWSASATIPVRHSLKRPKYTSLPSFTQSIITPVLSPFTPKWDNGVLNSPLFEQYAGSDTERSTVLPQGQDGATANARFSLSPQSSDLHNGLPATSPSRFPSNMFKEFAISPPDLTTFPFCHFEQMLSPSLIGRDPHFPTDDTPGSDNHTVSGCFLSGCHGHEPSHDQDGHPSPAVWSPSTVAAMRKQWRQMRKQPPAQTAVPLRPCLKKMSAHSTNSSLPDSRDSSRQSVDGGRTLSSSSLGVGSAFGNLDTDVDSLARLHVDVAFRGIVPGEWSAGNRSRSTSGASSTMLFSPFPSDHEDSDPNNWTPEMALHILEDDELTEVEEYMLQGLLRAFTQPRTASTAGTIKASSIQPSFRSDIAEDDLGTTPTPTSILTEQAIQREQVVPSHLPRPDLAVSAHLDSSSPSSLETCESPRALEPDLPSFSNIVGHMAAISMSGNESANRPCPLLSPSLDPDAEIDGEWQWACPITVPIPIRSGSISAIGHSPPDMSSIRIFQQSCSPTNVPSRSNSIISSNASTTGEKRRVHFPVCPGGNGEMALCALYPTYSATDYDRSPLEPPSEEERSCRMPERGSRDLSEEEEYRLVSQEEVAARQVGDDPSSFTSLLSADALSEHELHYVLPDIDQHCESAAALEWSCSNDFLSTLAAGGHDPVETDDNWEDWLDRRKSPCQLNSSSSTATLKASFEDSRSDPLLTPTNTPLDRSPFESPSVESCPGDSSDFLSLAPQPAACLEKENKAVLSDTPSHTNTGSVGPSASNSQTPSDTQFLPQEMVSADGPDLSESWLPHSSSRHTSYGSSSEATTTKSSTSVPKLKKKKKTVSSEKRTTLWTQTQSTWDQFGSDSWSTGEEGCLGGF